MRDMLDFSVPFEVLSHARRCYLAKMRRHYYCYAAFYCALHSRHRLRLFESRVEFIFLLPTTFHFSIISREAADAPERYIYEMIDACFSPAFI